jgi:hypothetical protein
MGFQYEDEELELIYKGQTYKYRAPSAVEQQNTGKKFKSADESTDVIGIYLNFFEGLGLPKEVLEKMSTKGLSDLFVYTLGSKKN